jgi:hypothetical protein
MEQVIAQMLAEIRTNWEKIIASQKHLKEEIRTNQALMDASLWEMRACQELLKEEMLIKWYTHHERMMARMGSWLEKMEACLRETEVTDLEVNPEEMKSIAVH